MTEVVTDGAAYTQLYPYFERKQFASGAHSASSQAGLAVETSEQEQSQAAGQTVAGNSNTNQSAANQPAETVSQLPALTSVQAVFLAQTVANAAQQIADSTSTQGTAPGGSQSGPASTSSQTSNAASQASGPSSQTSDASSQTSGVTTSASASQSAQAQAASQPQASGVLPPAAGMDDGDLERIEANVIGAAFAPREVDQFGARRVSTQLPKDFIFAQHQIFTDTGEIVFANDKSVSPSAAVTTSQSATTNVSVDTSNGNSNSATPQIDTQGQPNGNQDSGNVNPDSQASDSRLNLYLRAQAVADALSDKSSNPAVQKLEATLASYALTAGIDTGANAAARPTVSVTA